MPNKPTREQLPFYNRFMRYIDDASFLSDIESLRVSKVNIQQSTYENIEEFEDGDVTADEIPSPLHQFMMKYNLPLIMEDFVCHYVDHREVALNKLRNGVYLVDNKDTEASGNSDDNEMNFQSYARDTMHNSYIEVTLAIPVYATTTQINDTIKQQKQFIKDRQTQANDNKPVKRVRSEYYALRDKEIMRLYDSGVPPREIIFKLPEKWKGMNGPAISRVIYRRKQQQKSRNLPS